MNGFTGDLAGESTKDLLHWSNIFYLKSIDCFFSLSVFSEVFTQVRLFVEHLLHFMDIDKIHLSSPLWGVGADECGV